MNRLSRWQQIQQCAEIFCNQWSSDYLQYLQLRSKWRLEIDNLKLGQLILLKQPNMPLTKWLSNRSNREMHF